MRGGAFGGGTSRAAPAQPPAAPSLSATPADGTVHLSWTAPANGGAPITNYNVYRGTAAGGETLLKTLGNVTSYDDSTAVNGTKYYYRVAAVNSVGEGAQSNEVNATPPPSISVDDVSQRRGRLRPDRLHLHGLAHQPELTAGHGRLRDPGRHRDDRRLRLRRAHRHAHLRPGPDHKTVTVKVNGDTTFETDEGFTLKLSTRPKHDHATAPARHDPERRRPAQLSVNDVSKPEGNSGQTDFTLHGLARRTRATRPSPSTTRPRTAPRRPPGSDYAAASGTLTFDPGQTTKTVTVKVTSATTIRIGNDVQVATEAEFHLGAGREFSTSLLGVCWGTGVGGGLIIDGKPWPGRGAAGEIGHMVVKRGGAKCPCGRRAAWRPTPAALRWRPSAPASTKRTDKTDLFKLMDKHDRDRA